MEEAINHGETIMLKRLRGELSLLLMGLAVMGLAVSCQDAVVSQTPTAAEPLSQSECEAQVGFAFIEAGEFIRGSDRTERDYAYQISAEGAAESAAESAAEFAAESAAEFVAEVASIEANYRKAGWFDREPERQRVVLPAFCLQRKPRDQR